MTDLALLSTQKHIATLTLNQVKTHNALSVELIDALLNVFNQIEQTPDIRVLMINSASKHFCAGADLADMKNATNLSTEDNTAAARKLAELMFRLNQLAVPTIACAQGGTFGGGVGLVAACDIAIAHPDSLFCLSEVKLGLTPSVISPFVTAAIGARLARRWFVSAETIDAATALTWQLISEVSDNPNQQAQQLAEQISNNAPLAVKQAKGLALSYAFDEHLPSLLDQRAKEMGEQRLSAEAQEGFSAFFEKRTPNWPSA